MTKEQYHQLKTGDIVSIGVKRIVVCIKIVDDKDIGTYWKTYPINSIANHHWSSDLYPLNIDIYEILNNE